MTKGELTYEDEPEDFSLLLGASSLTSSLILVFLAVTHELIVDLLFLLLQACALSNGFFQLVLGRYKFANLTAFVFVSIFLSAATSSSAILLYYLHDIQHTPVGVAIVFVASIQFTYCLIQVAARLGMRLRGALRSDL